VAVVGDVISWPIAITGAAVRALIVAQWLGICRPVLRQFEDTVAGTRVTVTGGAPHGWVVLAVPTGDNIYAQ